MLLKRRFSVFVFMCLWLLSGAIANAQPSQTLTVFAAASLTNAFEEIALEFEAAHTGVDILFNFASSSDLATQIVEGAPADVFASANNAQMNVVNEAGRVAARPRTFAKNRLVLIVPADNPAAIMGLSDLANVGVQLIVAAPAVPVRTYTETMLERMANSPAYGQDYVDAVRANIVSEEQNVRQVAAKIALGEGDAGIVYVSDVTPDISAQVIALPIPDELNTIATYPIATLRESANSELAEAFVAAVLSDVGQNILVRWGFISVRIPALPSTIARADATHLFTVDGQVLNPLRLTVDDLRANFAPHTLEVTYQSGDQAVRATFTGVLLWQILSAAQPNLNADVPNDRLSMFLVVTGSDGAQAVIAWGEIDPEFANQPILLAYEQDGDPITDARGNLRLVVPTDQRGGRYVSGVVNISLRDAPPVAD